MAVCCGFDHHFYVSWGCACLAAALVLQSGMSLAKLGHIQRVERSELVGCARKACSAVRFNSFGGLIIFDSLTTAFQVLYGSFVWHGNTLAYTRRYMRECQTWDADVAVQVWRLLWWPLHAWSLDIQSWRLREQELSFWWLGWFRIVWESHHTQVAGVRDNWSVEVLERLRYLWGAWDFLSIQTWSSWVPTLPNTWSLL